MKAKMIRQALATTPDVEFVEASAVCDIRVAGATTRKLVVLHDKADSSDCTITIEAGAHLELTEIFLSEAFRRLKIEQHEGSTSNITLLELGSSNADLKLQLNGPHAESHLQGLFLASAGSHCEVALRTEHNSPQCRSNSQVKGVASGEGAFGRFSGMVYVAPDAQQTDARQTSRNIELTPGARIRTEPQLEIYADDVKCSHGATVGQLDGDAILYMRQRGLTEQQARRLQIEGFAGDVVCHHCNPALGELLCTLVAEKLQEM